VQRKFSFWKTWPKYNCSPNWYYLYHDMKLRCRVPLFHWLFSMLASTPPVLTTSPHSPYFIINLCTYYFLLIDEKRSQNIYRSDAPPVTNSVKVLGVTQSHKSQLEIYSIDRPNCSWILINSMSPEGSGIFASQWCSCQCYAMTSTELCKYHCSLHSTREALRSTIVKFSSYSFALQISC